MEEKGQSQVKHIMSILLLLQKVKLNSIIEKLVICDFMLN